MKQTWSPLNSNFETGTTRATCRLSACRDKAAGGKDVDKVLNHSAVRVVVEQNQWFQLAEEHGTAPHKVVRCKL